MVGAQSEVRSEIAMVVDAGQEERRVVQRSLERLGFPVVTAETTEAAIEIMRCLEGKIAIVFADVDDPERVKNDHGVTHGAGARPRVDDLIRAFQRENNGVRTVVLSSLRLDVDHLRRQGAFAFLQTPVDFGELRALTRRLSSRN
jgi:CheY-like chemotaxis protein